MLSLGTFMPAVIPRIELSAIETEVAGSIRFPLLILGATMIASSAWLSVSWRVRDTRQALARIGLSFVAIYAVTLGIVMPQFAATKTYKPQGEWIRERVGAGQTHIGMVYPGGGGIRKRGAFAFETGGIMVDLLDNAEQVETFFARYPGSIVLIESSSADTLFDTNPAALERHKLRELWVGGTLYIVIGSADPEVETTS
jgi:hypothetical protein